MSGFTINFIVSHRFVKDFQLNLSILILSFRSTPQAQSKNYLLAINFIIIIGPKSLLNDPCLLVRILELDHPNVQLIQHLQFLDLWIWFAVTRQI